MRLLILSKRNDEHDESSNSGGNGISLPLLPLALTLRAPLSFFVVFVALF